MRFRLAKSKSIALPSPTKEKVEFGKLKRIRSGEILTGSPEHETESDSTLDCSFERPHKDDTVHHRDVANHHRDVTDHRENVTATTPTARHSVDGIPLFEQVHLNNNLKAFSF